eukprot:2944089-Alexandrium_andersonii.AAC.1
MLIIRGVAMPTGQCVGRTYHGRLTQTRVHHAQPSLRNCRLEVSGAHDGGRRGNLPLRPSSCRHW